MTKFDYFFQLLCPISFYVLYYVFLKTKIHILFEKIKNSIK